MARNVTLAQIRTEVVNQGGYKNSHVFTPAVLNAWINRAIAKVYDLVWEADNDYYTTEVDLQTTAGSDGVALPADFQRLISLARQDGGEFRRLRRMRQHEWAKWEGHSGEPSRYRLQRGNIRLAPKPDSVYALKLLYLPVAPTLAADDDEFDSIDYFDELVIAEVLLKCAARDERSTVELERTIQRLERSIRGRADGRDAGEPMYLADFEDGEF